MKDLEKRVSELERIVRELIQYKEDRQIIQLDENGKEIGFAIHNYHMEEPKARTVYVDEDGNVSGDTKRYSDY